jgi:hypothetical protein
MKKEKNKEGKIMRVKYNFEVNKKNKKKKFIKKKKDIE